MAGLLPLSILPVSVSAAGAPIRPPLMLARTYREGTPLGDYWVSEKYDGVRAYWNGQQLRTRSGEMMPAPAWFTRDWPAHAMDGELWAGRGGFEAAVSAVRRDVPADAQWRGLRFMVFDLPEHPGNFDQRLSALPHAVARVAQPWVQAVPHRKVGSHGELRQWLEALTGQGGEGLMLHRGASLYQAGRSDDLLKFKLVQDAEATVIGYLPGKGKYQGMVGALVVKNEQGLRFQLGSGLSDALRRDPPAVGTLVTYRYQGVHPSGKPRFAVLWRPRLE